MALTIDQTLQVLDHRLSSLFTMTELDTSIYDTYQDAVSVALLEQGHTVTDITSPTDTDLLSVTNIPYFLDLAELRSMETYLNHLLPKVNVAFADRSHQFSQAVIGLEKAIERKRKSIQAVYGLPRTAGGNIKVRRLKRNTDLDDD